MKVKTFTETKKYEGICLTVDSLILLQILFESSKNSGHNTLTMSEMFFNWNACGNEKFSQKKLN